MIKNAIISALVFTWAYALFFILTVWGAMTSPELFFKITLSYAVIIVLHAIAIGALYVLKEEGELKDGNYLG